MPVIVRGTETDARDAGDGVAVRSLLSPDNTGSDHVLLDLVSFAEGAAFDLALDTGAIGWLQVLEGSGSLAGFDTPLDREGVTYLPLGYTGSFTAAADNTRLLVALVPAAARFDSNVASTPDVPRTADWTREPVLKSEHDERSRIYMATRGLTGTEAYRGELIRYPAGTEAPAHHHEGAEHFQYVLTGTGTAKLGDQTHKLSAGDVLYNYENEIHSFLNENDEEFSFVEFFVPGGCKTVWVPGAEVCAWLPTGADIKGRPPAREIAYHVHGEDDGI
jgi:quercetin dioxygenase-like cupin family protein